MTELNLDGLLPIELSGMDSVRLMNRIDTKYLTDVHTLKDIFGKVAELGYFVFEIGCNRITGYSSIYYDTAEHQMYLDHHNRKLVRQKIRTRLYCITGRVFLELKTKDNHGRTKKKRLEISPDDYKESELMSSSISRWLDERIIYSKYALSPSLETVFSRITIVNPEKTERSTIDFNIRFNNLRNGKSEDMGDLAIIEIKQDGNTPSKLRDILLDCRVKPTRISKYCIGLAMTDDTIKSGRFKKKIMLINKMKNKI